MTTLDVDKGRQDRARVRASSTIDADHSLLTRRAAGEIRADVRESLSGKRVLVTGAGGSIGSEIVRQLSQLDVERIHLLDHDESALHALQLQLRGHGLLVDDDFILADVRDRSGIRRTFRRVQPQLVFHAAAHKHLPLLERFPSEAVKTNLLGTDNVAHAAVQCGAELFVNVSTDKAARPTSMLGMTKRLAESVTTSCAGSATRVASVRFGNVLGSRGSFLQSLAYQIDHGERVTITHPEATRFFMTIPEAAILVIEASLMANSGEIYVFDMGEPVPILDLAHRFAEATGRTLPEIHFTGLRPGEKLHEELYDGEEERLPTRHPRVFMVQPKTRPPADLRQRIDDLYPFTVIGDQEQLLRALMDLMHDIQSLRNSSNATAQANGAPKDPMAPSGV